MTKRVVKKKPSTPRRKPSIVTTRKVPDAMENPEANDEVREAGGDKSKGPAKSVAKVVNLIFSVGDDDRGRTFEKMVEDIKKALGETKPPWADWFCGECKKKLTPDDPKCPKCGSRNIKVSRKPGPHVAVTGGYYILDGKVCLPDDYDPRKKQFRKGAVPPEWAGGPKTAKVRQSATQKQMDWDIENLSSDEYDKKYRLGKHAPTYKTEAQIREEQRVQMEVYRAEKAAREEEEMEEFGWDEGDAADDEKMGKVADKSAKRAIKKMQSTPKKRVVKKSTTKKATSKKVVRRTKK